MVSDNLDEQMIVVKANPKFYMTSYLVYLLAARTIDYPGLYKKDIMQDANAWPYVVYPQLVEKNQWN